ncbi:MAG: DUF3071 domain-containing protein [Actinomycetales bacterium]|nr:DUF3071 domain-containing protein [Actinomycetales bacterium]
MAPRVEYPGAIRTSRRERTLKPLSPREIQLRVRAGASPETVSAETGWALDRVQRYADQILIERGWVAERARQVELRTADGPVTLGEAAESVAYAEGYDPQDLIWDSWRRPDGRWVVTATVDVDTGIVRGTWIYDTVGRTIHPLDDAAIWYMGASDMRLNQLVVQANTGSRNDRAARPRLVAVQPEEPPTRETTAIRQPAAAQPQEQPVTDRPVRSKSSKGRKRASVPSWDEILFGATRGDD